jgi:hypothetical protein
MKALMRYYSYLFHLLLALFLLGVSGLALASGPGNLHLGMLPWTGPTLTYVVFFGALVGLIAVFLAIKGTLRILFLLWSALVAILLIKGYIFSGYRFHGAEFKTAMYLIVASLIALPGAWFQLRRVRKY